MLGKQPERRLRGPRPMQGDATASSFGYLLAETPYRERHQSAKPWGFGGKAPAACEDPKASL